MSDLIEITLDAVIVAVTDGVPRLLTVTSDEGLPALPSGVLKRSDRTIEEALRRWVREQTALELGYVEQLYTFGDKARTDGAESKRMLSIAYLALVREAAPSAGAKWVDWYDFFPWEDHRVTQPEIWDEKIVPQLAAFVAEANDKTTRLARQDRCRTTFATKELFDGIRALERCELLYEAGLLQESKHPGQQLHLEDIPMHLDHRRIAATALSRLRGKLTYRPVVFELLAKRFTLLQLQTVVEALSGKTLHKQNFRRLVEGGGLVARTGEMTPTRGRPAELFEFRREVLHERPKPGLG